ncbi:restriction endonuclease subunit S [Herminiimonas glaciei]|uniref:Restriction endonuclease subunit S n=1 Tax=Herminiimonas glaciei TaxID=523788 RepID=A0ABW2ICM9_9BURK
MRLGEVTSKVTDGDHKTPPRISSGFKLLSAKNVRNGFLSFDNCDFISEQHYLKSRERCLPEAGDLLIVSVGGTIGRASLVPQNSDFALVRSVALIKPLLLDSKYLKYSMNSDLLQASIHSKKRGGAQPCLYLSEIVLFRFPLPPLFEQNRIVSKIEELMALCDTLDQHINAASNKQAELLNALMHTQSQAEVKAEPSQAVPSCPQVINLADYRATIGGYIISKLANAPSFGRTAAAKVLYLTQAHIGLALDLKPEREAAGPLDTWIYEFERQGQSKHWFEVNEKTLANGRKKTEYRRLSALSEPAAQAETLMTPAQKTEFDRLIYALADKKTEEVEIIATLFAVWNDFLIDGTQPTDAQIISDVRENWHERKARFTSQELKQWLGWLRKENFIPRGLPPRTVQQSKLGFD